MHDPDRPTGGLPTTCPECGSQLGPNRALLGWSPCLCPGVTNGGHTIVRCRACLDRHVDSVRYDPPHLSRGHPVTVW